MTADVAVVGAGIVGAATAHALARAGAGVTVYEQFRRGHERGSSHGRSRIVRLAYADPSWVELARESFAGWRRLEAEAGEPLLVLDGLLEIVHDLAASSAGALDACGVPWQELDAAAAAERFGVRIGAGERVLLQEEAGTVLAERALAAFLRGLRVVEGHRVGSLEELAEPVVVVAAGAWAPALAAQAGIALPVRVTRETVAFFEVPAGRRLPSVIDLAGDGADVYSLADPVHGLKVGLHHAGAEADPAEPGAPDAALVAELAAWVGRRFPEARPEPVGAESCLYTTTADERFVLERRGRVVVGSACSGHGFKFAPAVGERLAALALAGPED